MLCLTEASAGKGTRSGRSDFEVAAAGASGFASWAAADVAMDVKAISASPIVGRRTKFRFKMSSPTKAAVVRLGHLRWDRKT